MTISKIKVAIPQDNQPFHMWTWWRNKYGVVSALEDYYAEQLQIDPMLMQALVQMKTAEVFIEARMRQLADEEDVE